MTSYELGALLAPTHRHTVRLVAVSHAVGRDHERLVRALDEQITTVRRAALAEHVGFVLDQLRAHHLLLDRAVAPILTLRRADLDDRLAALEAAHLYIAERATPVRDAARRWLQSGSPDDRAALRSAIEEFDETLDPVVDADVEVLTIAAEALRDIDWVAIHRGRGRRSRPTTVARQLFWLLDGLDPQQGEALVDGISRAGLWVLRNGFSGAYNRSSYLMWHGGGTGPAV